MSINIRIFFIRKHLSALKLASIRYKLDYRLILAIAILEDINRPKLRRMMEKMYFRIRGKTMTFGLMQVSNDSPLSDIESINMAAKMISDWGPMEIYYIGLKYNGSPDYARCLEHIHSRLISTNL